VAKSYVRYLVRDDSGKLALASRRLYRAPADVYLPARQRESVYLSRGKDLKLVWESVAGRLGRKARAERANVIDDRLILDQLHVAGHLFGDLLAELYLLRWLEEVKPRFEALRGARPGAAFRPPGLPARLRPGSARRVRIRGADIGRADARSPTGEIESQDEQGQKDCRISLFEHEYSFHLTETVLVTLES
jgi:hypothetical protein